MRDVRALAAKDLRLMLHDRMGLFFGFAFPILYAVFFGIISSGFAGGGGGSAIPIAVVDEDGTEASASFVADLAKDPAVGVERMDRDAASERVRRGKLAAYVVIGKGFGDRRAKAMMGGEPVRFVLGSDPARQAEAAMLQGGVVRAVFEPMRAAMGGREPVVVEREAVQRRRFGPNNAYAVTFPQAILWGIMGCAAGFGISLVIERTQGTLQRLAMAPLGRARILAGKALACFLTIVAVTALLLGIAIAVFGVRPGSYPLLAAGIASNAVAFTGIMMLLSVVGKTERAAASIGWGVLVLLAMIGGGMIPLFVMPPWLQQIASFSPVKWGILALEGAIWRGFSLEEMMLPCGILLALGAVCFSLGARLFRW